MDEASYQHLNGTDYEPLAVSGHVQVDRAHPIRLDIELPYGCAGTMVFDNCADALIVGTTFIASGEAIPTP